MKNYLILFASLLVLSIGLFSCNKSENRVVERAVVSNSFYDINQGAHIVAPHLTEKLIQSEGIVMYILTLEPGDTLPWHEHPPHTFYVLQEGTLEVISEDSTMTSFYPKGQAEFGSPSREMVINTGAKTIKVLIHDFYYLDPDESNDPAYNMNGGAHLVAPDLVEILHEKRGIVMYELIMEPGDTLPWHSHPTHIFYVLEKGTLELTFENGTTTSVYNPGRTNINPPFSDMAINTGTTTLKILIHEFYSLDIE